MLGSMQFAVKWQADYWQGQLRPGDVLLSSHPVAGGVHLPDFTIVTPVFDASGENIIFCESKGGCRLSFRSSGETRRHVAIMPMWAASRQAQCLRNRDPSSMKGLPS
jgi:hypothetical protein